MATYVISTHLKDKPNTTFYYKGTSNEDGVSFAMNTIVAFDTTEAMPFHDKEQALQLCEKLNLDEQILSGKGYTKFSVEVKE